LRPADIFFRLSSVRQQFTTAKRIGCCRASVGCGSSSPFTISNCAGRGRPPQHSLSLGGPPSEGTNLLWRRRVQMQSESICWSHVQQCHAWPHGPSWQGKREIGVSEGAHGSELLAPPKMRSHEESALAGAYTKRPQQQRNWGRGGGIFLPYCLAPLRPKAFGRGRTFPGSSNRIAGIAPSLSGWLISVLFHCGPTGRAKWAPMTISRKKQKCQKNGGVGQKRICSLATLAALTAEFSCSSVVLASAGAQANGKNDSRGRRISMSGRKVDCFALVITNDDECFGIFPGASFDLILLRAMARQCGLPEKLAGRLTLFRPALQNSSGKAHRFVGITAKRWPKKAH